MVRCKLPPLERNLDVGEMARRKLAVFGAKTRPLMLERAANYERHGHHKTAKFWRAVADTIDDIAAETAEGAVSVRSHEADSCRPR